MIVTENSSKVFRVLDANLNRLKEALRVCEEYYRFVQESQDALSSLKNFRHRIKDIVDDCLDETMRKQLIASRDVQHDSIAKETSDSESTRHNMLDVLYANIQRSKESLRVLEEYGKIISPQWGEKFQELRFDFYEWEQNILLEKRSEV